MAACCLAIGLADARRMHVELQTVEVSAMADLDHEHQQLAITVGDFPGLATAGSLVKVGDTFAAKRTGANTDPSGATMRSSSSMRIDRADKGVRACSGWNRKSFM